ncbi:TetR/AcrR family transcriptional regulator [Cytobacillus depressus]|uniref:TetR/AcrR family transcriptional regulator n=1 Tax=Cytobacillus depressus TaxID=1602942 RepID=A0A6L3UZP2_9BACI|nr:TetR family transcriptional regulator [Cytobacillus depressus]KAB2329984.1 TetR/AcrR family transcriptional regulator [Cytobacillus depressus]
MMNKKEKIVQAAIEVFKEKGIEKTKISDIVKLAGIAQGTYYLYFPSKLAVMPAIAEVMVEKSIAVVKNEVKRDASFTEQLVQIVDAIFKVTMDYREILALIYAGLASTEHIKEWETVYQPFYSWISEFLKEAKETGVIRESIHVERTSKLLIGLIEIAAEQIYLYDYRQDDQAEIQKAEVLEFLKHALGIQEK